MVSPLGSPELVFRFGAPSGVANRKANGSRRGVQERAALLLRSTGEAGAIL